MRSFCLVNLLGHRRRGKWWPVAGVGRIKGRNSVHLEAYMYAAKIFPYLTLAAWPVATLTGVPTQPTSACWLGFVNSPHPALKFTRKMSETLVTFIDINISVQHNNLATSVYYNPQIRTVTYCIHLPIHLMSKTQFHTPNFSGSVDSAVKIQILTPNAMKCLISFPNLAILTTSYLKYSIVSKTPIENPL